MRDLSERLDGWVAAGLLDRGQADAIAAHESGRAARPASGQAFRGRLAEAVGYLGAALAAGAVGLFLRETWPALSAGARLGVLAVLTLLFATAGAAVAARPDPSLRRLTGTLWAAAAVAAGWFTWSLAHQLGERTDHLAGVAGGAAACAVACALLPRRPGGPLQLVALGGAIVAAVALVDLPVLRADAFWTALAAWGLGLAWWLLGRGGWLPPRRVAEVLGGLTTVGAMQLGSFGDLRAAALTLGIVSAGVLIVSAVTGDGIHQLMVGAIAAFVLVPQLVFELFGGAIGAPATLLVVGVLLLLLAVTVGRARREVGDADRPAGAPRSGP